MKRFQFRPAAVLELRRRQHEAAQRQLVRAQRERDEAARVRDEAIEATAGAEADMHARLHAGADVETIMRHRNWIARQRAAADGKRRAHAARQTDVERATDHVRRTRRQMRALERLRDRAWRAHLTEVGRLEAIELDRLAIVRFTRAKAGGIEGDDN
jgi:flagellar export protein FliJ